MRARSFIIRRRWPALRALRAGGLAAVVFCAVGCELERHHKRTRLTEAEWAGLDAFLARR